MQKYGRVSETLYFALVSTAITKDIRVLGWYLTRIFDSEKVWSGIEMGFYGPIVTATECSAFTGLFINSL